VSAALLSSAVLRDVRINTHYCVSADLCRVCELKHVTWISPAGPMYIQGRHNSL